MRVTWKELVMASGLILGGALHAGSVGATPPSGFTGSTLALGQFEDIDVRNQVPPRKCSASPCNVQ